MTCPICKGERIQLHYDKDPRILRCTSCGFIFHTESTENENEEESYRKFIRSGKLYRPRDRVKYLHMVDRMKKLPVTGLKICEIGARDGHFLTLCRESGYEVQAVEPSPVMAGLLKEKGIPVKNGLYKKEMFSEDEFDFLVMIQVLEHIPFPVENALSIAGFHLRKGGYVIIEIPSVRNPGYLIDRFLKSDKRFPTLFIRDHCNYFSPRTLSLAASKAGFRKISLSTGRLREKYSGIKRIIGYLFDPLFNLLNMGGILYIGQKTN